ncbi:hypothetical protein [Meridianimarinicoccus aquatilis]|uniref:Uncharacterized protein n=1 Tax=Meridianimarinicoccus aquatilis TaxID=2552766 RepID=A0A4V6PPA8_9RHOB|nr:hypothetical protein [Fluviibacterium aquatile]TDL83839.1 hypothetical protein E2L05_19035 [Fluviibacterium aquatile]
MADRAFVFENERRFVTMGFKPWEYCFCAKVLETGHAACVGGKAFHSVAETEAGVVTVNTICEDL